MKITVINFFIKGIFFYNIELYYKKCFYNIGRIITRTV